MHRALVCSRHGVIAGSKGFNISATTLSTGSLLLGCLMKQSSRPHTEIPEIPVPDSCGGGLGIATKPGSPSVRSVSSELDSPASASFSGFHYPARCNSYPAKTWAASEDWLVAGLMYVATERPSTWWL
ncbi:hypothetical protein BU16DRAFT_531443 [Lophium mytilinum]|uniref:Uncharacterized protein n=1 Tax=Lophium mytilinum TaxID=390894 RepID=A0A6A6QF48_9PEZI|nr:hypothetical protein BU16DRAFT_531443 [Lophium mytilinum]